MLKIRANEKNHNVILSITFVTKLKNKFRSITKNHNGTIIKMDLKCLEDVFTFNTLSIC